MIETAERAILLLAERAQLDEHHIQHHHSITELKGPLDDTQAPPLPADITEYFRPSTAPLVSTLSSPFPLPTVAGLGRGESSRDHSARSELLRRRLDPALLKSPLSKDAAQDLSTLTLVGPSGAETDNATAASLAEGLDPLLPRESSSERGALPDGNVEAEGTASGGHTPDGILTRSNFPLVANRHLRRKGSGSSSLSRVQFADPDNDSSSRRDKERESGRQRSKDWGGSRLRSGDGSLGRPP